MLLPLLAIVGIAISFAPPPSPQNLLIHSVHVSEYELPHAPNSYLQPFSDKLTEIIKTLTEAKYLPSGHKLNRSKRDPIQSNDRMTP